jgi:hypothetical protein
MTNIRKWVGRTEEQFPTHDEIQKRAHELYLKRGGQHGQDIEDWFIAEQQLRKERAAEAAPDWLVAEEERTAVRAGERIKEERTDSVVPRSKSAAVGQQRKK